MKPIPFDHKNVDRVPNNSATVKTQLLLSILDITEIISIKMVDTGIDISD